MYNNKNYKRDISYTYELNRFFLRILGVWPNANKKICLLQKLTKSVLIFGCYFILCCDLISVLLYIFVVQKETRARIKVIGVVLFMIVSILKYSNMLYVENQMKDCLACVEKDFQSVTSSTERNTMLFHVKTSRHLLILCGIFMYGAGMTYRTAIPLSRGKIVTAQNITIRPLPCPAYYVVFDPQISPAYEIVFFVQCFTGFISFLDMVQGVVHFSSFVELVACTSILCLMIYCLIMEWEASNAVAICTYCILVMSFTFNTFIYCFIGEQLSEKGEEVAWTACTLDWHLLPDANVRALILIMLMCNKTMKLKAGNYLELSFRTFGSVVKTGVGYLNLLRSVVD
ncbi:uncharacterized protein LOC116853713 isoform X2 [Odontomachus brunneus]|uniref:uncharacterized protein LOC116853713 isoform X2 n=1 Tax=Odontomachus brunneus TaxID=486640 RepID=UPI0013F1DA58|nr:uncharacterized protein LOC116853713 isoform X2 [Odontomachus brunneus]